MTPSHHARPAPATTGAPLPARPAPSDATPKSSPVLPTLLTIDQAATRIGMSARYVRRLIAERQIVSYRLGRSVRIDPADLAAHVHAGRIDPITTTTVWTDLRRAA